MLDQLLAGLDMPRQALANLGRGIGRGLSGNGSWSDLLGAAPGALGTAVAAPLIASGVGAPLGILAGSAVGGLAQGIGKATGMDAFNAPTAADLTESLGGDRDSWMQNMAVSAATDPLTYAGLGAGAKGAGMAAEAAPGILGKVAGGLTDAAGAVRGGIDAAVSPMKGAVTSAMGKLGSMLSGGATPAAEEAASPLTSMLSSAGPVESLAAQAAPPIAPSSMYHIADYKNPANSVNSAIQQLERKGSPLKHQVWDGPNAAASFDANMPSQGAAFQFDKGTYPGTIEPGATGISTAYGKNPLPYDPSLQSILYNGDPSSPGYQRLMAAVDAMNKNRGDAGLMGEYGHSGALSPVALMSMLSGK